MAEIVLGIGTSHGPMLVTDTELWSARLPADRTALHAWRGKRWSFDDLVETLGIRDASATLVDQQI